MGHSQLILTKPVNYRRSLCVRKKVRANHVRGYEAYKELCSQFCITLLESGLVSLRPSTYGYNWTTLQLQMLTVLSI